MHTKPPGRLSPESSPRHETLEITLPNLADHSELDRAEVTSTRQTETRDRAPASVRERIRPTLTVLTGVDAGRLVTLDRELIIGRVADCQLSLTDLGVSRHHAKMTARAGVYMIEDLGSKNGTYVDGRKADPTYVLEPNSVILLGPNVSIRFAMMTFAEERLARDLFDSSMRDPLTRAFNRRYFMNRLKAEATFAVRHKTVLSVLAFDLDHFKKLNDTHGHAGGDAILKRVVEDVGEALRTEDVLARVGGEEFSVLLRGIEREKARLCAERVRAAVAAAAEPHEGLMIYATISLGLADSQECGMDTNKMLALADQRLYKAKASGRNRVCAD